MPRIVACGMCLKIERMPDPPPGPRVEAAYAWDAGNGHVERHQFTHDDGTPIMVAEYDPMLEDFVQRHGHDRPDVEAMNYVKVFECDEATYQSVDVGSEIRKELAKVTGEFYEEKDHYRTEAVNCFNAHGNPTVQTGCSDFRDSSKRIGRSHPDPSKQMFLCHMCPYMQSEIAREQRWKLGLYKPETMVKLRQQANKRAARRRARSRR